MSIKPRPRHTHPVPGEPDETIVFVYGNPESSYTYRRIRDVLAVSSRPLRMIAMDQIGFGFSDQASFEFRFTFQYLNSSWNHIRHRSAGPRLLPSNQANFVKPVRC